MNIRDFVNERLDKDEAAARAVQDNSAPFNGQWYNDEGHALRTANEWVLAYQHHGHEFPPGLLDHIARHDPARALREVAAKRRVMERHCLYDGALYDYCAGCPSGDDTGYPDTELADCPELQDLAYIWNDHPDWSEKWCPHLEGRHEVEVTEHRDTRYCYTNACNRCGTGDGWHYREDRP